MKKTFKRLSSAIISAAMFISAGITVMPSFAADYTVTIQKPSGSNDTAQHTYEAYQIFAGDLSGEGDDAVLASIEWGTGINSETFITALKASTAFGETNPFAACTTAQSVADIIDEWEPDNAANTDKDKHKAYIQAFADIAASNLTEEKTAGTQGNNKLTLRTAGYYLIKDKNGSLDGQKLGAYSDYMLKVVDTVTITAKEDVPTIEKKILEDSTLKEANTASIGDVVTFQLNSVVPDMSAYDKYFFVINDDMCEGLTFNSSSVKIYIGDSTSPIDSTYYQVQTNSAETDGHTFQIVMNNFKANYGNKAGQPIKVTYDATLNEKADGTDNGNVNTVNLTFSNNPNVKQNGTNEPSGDDPKGITPDSKTKTYTTGILLRKVDSSDNALTGAVFELKGTGVKKIVVTTVDGFKEDANGKYYKLNDGTYTIYPPTDANRDSYENVDKKYTLVTNTLSSSGSGADSYVSQTVDSLGIISFFGLGTGTYYLTETKAPPQYNKLANPIKIEITANPTFTSPNWTIKRDGSVLTAPNGIYEFKVVNNKGVTLPGTGGSGTAIFYIIGGIMVTGAFVLLITKKRMTNKEK